MPDAENHGCVKQPKAGFYGLRATPATAPAESILLSPRTLIVIVILFVGLIAGANAQEQKSTSDGYEQPTSQVLEGDPRVIIVAIDSLHPEYPSLNSLATGPGKDGDRLMPYVHYFLQTASTWSAAQAFCPQATDPNHLNIVAGTHSGQTGIINVFAQAFGWIDGVALRPELIHEDKARSEEGTTVETVFDWMEDSMAGNAVTAYLSNKRWIPSQYSTHVDYIVPQKVGWSWQDAQEDDSWLWTYQMSFHDNAFTDPDWACDPESILQTAGLETLRQEKPGTHPRDYWVVKRALEQVQTTDPNLMYVSLGDLDEGQHYLGSLNDEWVNKPIDQVPLPEGCQMQERYQWVSKSNQNLYKEPILDLVRDVDYAFGMFIKGLKDILGDYEFQRTVIVLVSDHNMRNYFPDTHRIDVMEALRAQMGDLVNGFHFRGAGSVGYLYVPPVVPVEQKDALVAWAKYILNQYRLDNPNTTSVELESPWYYVFDQEDMKAGVLVPNDMYNEFFVLDRAWPDLMVFTTGGWEMGSAANVDFNNLNAGHGAPDTAAVILSIKGFDYQPGSVCNEPIVYVRDVGITLGHKLGLTLPARLTGTQPLTCTPKE